MSQTRILLVEDDARSAQSLERLLKGKGYRVTVAHRGDEGLALARKEDFDVVVTDLRMPGLGGLELVRELHAAKPRVPIVLMTAFGTTETAIEATKHGAFEYLLKPFEMPELLEVVARAVAGARLMTEPVELGEEKSSGQAIIGNSRAMQTVYKEIGRVTGNSATVLIRGETGTGKELVARATYQHGERAAKPSKSSYAPVVPKEPFSETRTRMAAEKPAIMKRQMDLLQQRYDLRNDPAPGVTMSGGKPVQQGIRTKLKPEVTWDKLGAMPPEEVLEKDVFPDGFMALPHPNHPEGGMVFPKFHIDELKKQEARDLTRFDLDFDLPDHFLPEFPAPIFLTTRPDLGDVSKGRLVTLDNFFELFNGILNPKQLEGVRLLVTPFPQQQFNATDDRRSDRPHRGVSCLDCHANGHANGATHLAGDVRPQEFRHRIDTPTLRGVNIQRLFGSQRALKSVEDFTEFEQRAAYFDGDPVIATKKGVNPLERGSQVHFMAEFQELLDFPPAPKLGVTGKLNPAKASAAEMRGQDLFFGKAQCATCHQAPYYTDNLMHNLKAERFFKPRLINGAMATADGPIKTFPLRGIKDSPPYLHDGRLLTLEDTVEFFNLILETKLTAPEKTDLVLFLRAL